MKRGEIKSLTNDFNIDTIAIEVSEKFLNISKVSSHHLRFDTGIILLGENNRMFSIDHFVFYNNLTALEGALTCSPTHQKSQSNPILTFSPFRIPQDIKRVVLVGKIINRANKEMTFGDVPDFTLVFKDILTDQELFVQEIIEGKIGHDNTLEFGQFARNSKGQWFYEATYIPSNDGFQGFMQKYFL